jgi:hypothetical protein
MRSLGLLPIVLCLFLFPSLSPSQEEGLSLVSTRPFQIPTVGLTMNIPTTWVTMKPDLVQRFNEFLAQKYPDVHGTVLTAINQGEPPPGFVVGSQYLVIFKFQGTFDARTLLKMVLSPVFQEVFQRRIDQLLANSDIKAKIDQPFLHKKLNLLTLPSHLIWPHGDVIDVHQYLFCSKDCLVNVVAYSDPLFTEEFFQQIESGLEKSTIAGDLRSTPNWTKELEAVLAAQQPPAEKKSAP